MGGRLLMSVAPERGRFGTDAHPERKNSRSNSFRPRPRREVIRAGHTKAATFSVPVMPRAGAKEPLLPFCQAFAPAGPDSGGSPPHRLLKESVECAPSSAAVAGPRFDQHPSSTPPDNTRAWVGIELGPLRTVYVARPSDFGSSSVFQAAMAKAFSPLLAID